MSTPMLVTYIPELGGDGFLIPNDVATALKWCDNAAVERIAAAAAAELCARDHAPRPKLQDVLNRAQAHRERTGAWPTRLEVTAIDLASILVSMGMDAERAREMAEADRPSHRGSLLMLNVYVVEGQPWSVT